MISPAESRVHGTTRNRAAYGCRCGYLAPHSQGAKAWRMQRFPEKSLVPQDCKIGEKMQKRAAEFLMTEGHLLHNRAPRFGTLKSRRASAMPRQTRSYSGPGSTNPFLSRPLTLTRTAPTVSLFGTANARHPRQSCPPEYHRNSSRLRRVWGRSLRIAYCSRPGKSILSNRHGLTRAGRSSRVCTAGGDLP